MILTENDILRIIEEETLNVLLEQTKWKIPGDSEHEYSLTADGKGYVAYKGGKPLGTFRDLAGLEKVKDSAPQSVKTAVNKSSESGGSWYDSLKKSLGFGGDEEESPEKEREPEKDDKSNPVSPSIFQAIVDAVYSYGMPMHVRAFASYLMGRRRSFNYLDVTGTEYKTLKQLIVFSVTNEGRSASKRDPEAPGYLINYAVARALLKKYDQQYTAIYRGEEEKGVKSGVLDLEVPDQIAKTLGTASASGASISDIRNAMRNRKPIKFVIVDNYDFNDKAKLAGGIEQFFEDIKSSWKLLSKGSVYAAIRKMASWRQATGYKGYPVKIAISLKEKDYDLV